MLMFINVNDISRLAVTKWKKKEGRGIFYTVIVTKQKWIIYYHAKFLNLYILYAFHLNLSHLYQ